MLKLSKSFLHSFQRRSIHSSGFHFAIKPFLLADIGEGITECEVVQWFVNQGDIVQQFDKICEVQSDKAAVEITSRFDGKITKLHYTQGQMAKVGLPLVDIDMNEDQTSESNETSSDTHKTQSPTSAPIPAVVLNPILSVNPLNHNQSSQYILSTPSVRRVARENKINLANVIGTGKDGRIVMNDVQIHLNQPTTKKAEPINPSSQENPIPILKSPVLSSTQIVNLTMTQKQMFKQMTKSLSIPHFGFSEEIEMNKTMELKEELNLRLIKMKSPLIKITLMPILLKAMLDSFFEIMRSNALKEYPILNSSVVNENQLQYRSNHHIGIAMDTPSGLIVPVIKNVESKSIFEIAKDIQSLRLRSQTNEFTPDDLSGGTITLSNIGNIGGTLLHPVLLSNQVCIGSIGRIQKLPRFDVNGNIESRDIMYVSWNADHRVIDGATVAKFVSLWKTFLESPFSLMGELK